MVFVSFRMLKRTCQLDERYKQEERFGLGGDLPKDRKDVFARQDFLIAPGQLQVETYAYPLSSVYTLGPIF